MNEGGDMQESFRSFISLPVADAVKNEIRRVQNHLRTQLPEDALRWTRPEQIHLTLKFLGNVPEEKCDELAKVLKEACSGFAPITLRAETVGFFPERGTPRVAWIGVRDENDALSRLQQAVETAVGRIIPGTKEERFTGHLTIGRAKNLRHSQSRKLMELAAEFREKSFGEWKATLVELMRSELGSDGSRYTLLAGIQLEGGAG